MAGAGTTDTRSGGVLRRLGLILSALALIGYASQVLHHTWRHTSHTADGSIATLSGKAFGDPLGACSCAGHDDLRGDTDAGESEPEDDGGERPCKVEKTPVRETLDAAPPPIGALRRFAVPAAEQLCSAHRLAALQMAPKQSPPVLA